MLNVVGDVNCDEGWSGPARPAGGKDLGGRGRQLDGRPEMCGARPGIAGHLIVRGFDGSPVEQREGGPVDAGADGLLGRTNTGQCKGVERTFCKGVLEGVEGDDPQTPTGPKNMNGSGDSLTQLVELLVDCDTQG